jgi:FkbM family methyltransferase
MTSSVRARLYRVSRFLLHSALLPAISRIESLDKLTLPLIRGVADSALFAANIPNPLAVDGLTLIHDQAHRSLTFRSLALGTYEASVVRAMRAILRPGMGVLDIGAHLGYHTLQAARLVKPSGHVWSFEPDPQNRRFLADNVRTNGLSDVVTIVGSAVGASTGFVTLHRMRNDSGGSTIASIPANPDDVVVKLTSIDDWAVMNHWPKIALIKVDIEGAEPEALEGMAELLNRNEDVALILECQVDALRRMGHNPTRLFDQVRSLGFTSIRALADEGHDRRVLSESDVKYVLNQSKWYPINLLCARS